MIAFARAQRADLARRANPVLPDLTLDARSAVLRALDEFTGLMIGRMIVMGKALRSLI